LPLPVPAPPSSVSVIDRLRREVQRIEGCGSRPALATPRLPQAASLWTLGAPEADVHLGPAGLDAAGVHEIRPRITGALTGNRSAALAFAVRLVLRRLEALARAPGGRQAYQPVLWCQPAEAAREWGRLHGPGLAALGLHPGRFVLVEAVRAEDCLWAIEEGLKSSAFALVAGLVYDLDLTPARRLSLAARAGGTPCLALTAAGRDPAAATATRWSIAPAPNAPHAFDIAAPGAWRAELLLERSRGSRLPPMTSALTVEWSDETRRFAMAAALADRAHAPRALCRGAGP
jgi:hypothetical protein